MLWDLKCAVQTSLSVVEAVVEEVVVTEGVRSVFVKLENLSKIISSYWVMLEKKLDFIVDSMHITTLLLEYTVPN